MKRTLAKLVKWFRPSATDTMIVPAIILLGIIVLVVAALGGLIAIPLYFLEKLRYIQEVFVILGMIGLAIWGAVVAFAWWVLDTIDTVIDEKIDRFS